MSNMAVKESREVISFKTDAIIFAEGKPSKYLYLIKKGEVRLLKFHGQHLQAFEVCREGDILNEIGVLTGKPHQFTAVAKTDVEIVLIEQKDIQSVMHNSPDWISDIFKTLCERLEATQEMIQEHNLMAGEKDNSLILSKEDEKKYIEALSNFNSKI